MKMLVVLIGNWSRFDVITGLASSTFRHLLNSVRIVLLQDCANRTFTLVCTGYVVLAFHNQVMMLHSLWLLFLSDKVCERIEWANVSDLWG